MRDLRLYVKDISAAMITVQEFIKEMDFEMFLEDDKTTSAVVRKLEVIGEAAKNLPDTIRQKYPEVPWKQMAGMRDKLIHAYFGVDYTLVWDTVKNLIPPLQPIIAQILEDMEEETNDE
ncbi:MAG: DUF86 domain-containing protein [Candidatus Poribacteria bacterium]|nr:DUF86 domain-containing protein [Candidatus Poribacteria bacterium]